LAAAALGGGLLALGLPPLALAPLAMLGVGGLVWALAELSEVREAAWAGALFAGVASAGALHWAPAAAEPWLGVGGALVAGLSIWLLHAGCGAVALALAAALRHDLPLPLRAGAAMGILEWLPGAIPVVGVPWFSVAASLDGWGPLLPLVAVVGSGGFGALVAASWGAALALRTRAWRGAAAVGLIWAGVVAGALLLPPLPEPLEASASETAFPVALLSWERPRAGVADPEEVRARVGARLAQGVGMGPAEGAPADPPSGELLPGVPPRGEASLEGSGPAEASPGEAPLHLLWPEAPVPAPPAEDETALAWLQEVQRAGEEAGGGSVAGAHALVGGRRYNTLVRTGGAEEPPEGVHRKRFLVPGVERTSLLSPGRPGGGLAPGAGALPFAWGERRVGGLICFEILYPTEGARLRRRGATLLVQSTNDAMLQGGGRLPVLADAGRRQHKAMVRLRAAELRVPVVRSALGGRAFGVDARGREMTAVETWALPGVEGGAGAWVVLQVPPAPPAPPAAWLAPLLGPLFLGILGIPLVFVWRRGRLLAGSGSMGGGAETR
jgi:apolipoprotein N-acyltransferase